jgi:hypothetical protein
MREVEFTSDTWIWDLGSPWCSVMIQDEKLQFSGVGDDLVSKREHVSRGRLSEPVEAA